MSTFDELTNAPEIADLIRTSSPPRDLVTSIHLPAFSLDMGRQEAARIARAVREAAKPFFSDDDREALREEVAKMIG